MSRESTVGFLGEDRSEMKEGARRASCTRQGLACGMWIGSVWLQRCTHVRSACDVVITDAPPTNCTITDANYLGVGPKNTDDEELGGFGIEFGSGPEFQKAYSILKHRRRGRCYSTRQRVCSAPQA